MKATREEMIFMLVERYKLPFEVVEALPDQDLTSLLEEEQPPVEGEEQPPTDTYSGLQAGDIVGDTRRLKVVSINPVSGEDSSVVGEAWQDEDGVLHGTGLVAVMLFEPVSVPRYKNASIELDISPLTILYSRFARSPFMRAEFVEASSASR